MLTKYKFSKNYHEKAAEICSMMRFAFLATEGVFNTSRERKDGYRSK